MAVSLTPYVTMSWPLLLLPAFAVTIARSVKAVLAGTQKGLPRFDIAPVARLTTVAAPRLEPFNVTEVILMQ